MPDSNLRYGIGEGQYHIWADVCFKKAPSVVISGGIAHELAHITYDLKCRWKSRILDFLYPIPIVSRKLEIATDLEVIARGFHFELTEFTRWVNKTKPGKPISGFSLAELEAMKIE